MEAEAVAVRREDLGIRFTWNTVKKLWEKESKLLLGLCRVRSPRLVNLPPNTWVPSSAKMLRKRKRRTRSETMASTLFMSEARRFWSDLQYLPEAKIKGIAWVLVRSIGRKSWTRNEAETRNFRGSSNGPKPSQRNSAAR